MKILKIILITVFILIILVVFGFLVFIKTFDANKYLPQITQQIGQVINRQVSIKHVDLDLSFFKGLSLILKDISIKDDAAFSQGDFLVVDRAYLGLELMPLIAQRQINITSIVITSPKISMIRSTEGMINAQTMAPQGEQPGLRHAKSPAVPALEPPKSESSLPAISIKSISIEQGLITFEDRNAQMPLNLLIKDVDVKVNDFSLNDSFTFSIQLNAWAKSQRNIKISGRSKLDLSRNAISIKDLKVNSDLSQWDLEKVKAISTAFSKIPSWPQELQGQFLIEIPQLNASAAGLEKLALKLTISQGYLKFKELLSPLKNISVEVTSDLNDLTLKTFKASAGAGEIKAGAHIQGLLTNPRYDFQMETQGINIDELLDESAWPMVLKGALTAQIGGSGQSFEPEALMKNLKADGAFSLANARIEKFNILKTILGQLNFIPGLSTQVEGALSSSLKDKLNTDTTVLNKAEGKIKILDKVINLENADIESPVFIINVKGTVGFDLTTHIALKTIISADVSLSLTTSARPLRGLLDEKGRIYIPGVISGKIPSIGYKPEMDYISKKVLTAEGTEQISKQLDKVFEKNPEVRSILDGVLGSFLK